MQDNVTVVAVGEQATKTIDNTEDDGRHLCFRGYSFKGVQPLQQPEIEESANHQQGRELGREFEFEFVRAGGAAAGGGGCFVLAGIAFGSAATCFAFWHGCVRGVNGN